MDLGRIVRMLALSSILPSEKKSSGVDVNDIVRAKVILDQDEFYIRHNRSIDVDSGHKTGRWGDWSGF